MISRSFKSLLLSLDSNLSELISQTIYLGLNFAESLIDAAVNGESDLSL